MSAVRLRLLLCACALGFGFQANAAVPDIYPYATTFIEGWAGDVLGEDDGAPTEVPFSMSELRLEEGTAWSEGKARALIFDELGAYAGLSREGGDTDLYMTSFAQHYTRFLVTSDTLAMGTPIQAKINFSFEGTMTVMFDGDLMVPGFELPYADAYTLIQLSQTDKTHTVYEGLAVLDPVELYADTDWTDDWVMSGTDGNRMAMLDVLDEVTFNTFIGEELLFETLLWITATGTDHEGTLFVESDFYNSGSFSLASDDRTVTFEQVQLTGIPEPASMITLLTGGMLLACRRGWRGRVQN